MRNWNRPDGAGRSLPSPPNFHHSQETRPSCEATYLLHWDAQELMHCASTEIAANGPHGSTGVARKKLSGCPGKRAMMKKAYFTGIFYSGRQGSNLRPTAWKANLGNPPKPLNPLVLGAFVIIIPLSRSIANICVFRRKTVVSGRNGGSKVVVVWTPLNVFRTRTRCPPQ